MQVFVEDLQQDDIVLYQCGLKWVKSQDFQLPKDDPIPFLAYDEYCFYKVDIERLIVNQSRQTSHQSVIYDYQFS